MILVFGSINTDVLVPVPHLPLAGETVLGADYVIAPGGKGANQALAARRAGAPVMLAGAVGRDSFGEIALQLLRRAGVDLSLTIERERPTGCAAIMVDAGGENLIAVASGANLAAEAAQVPDRMLDAGTILVLQMEVPVAENTALIRRARARGARIILNLAPVGAIEPGVLAATDLVVANESEAAALGADRSGLASRLRQGLVVTYGAAGAVAFLADGSEMAVPALAIAPVDTTGAGDTFVGALAAGLDQGLALFAALRRASVAAGLACLGVGAQTAMPERAAIDAALARLPAA